MDFYQAFKNGYYGKWKNSASLNGFFLFSVVEEWKNDLQILDMEADLEEVSFEDLLMELLDEDSYIEERSYPNFEEVIRVGLNMTYYKVKNRMPDYDLFCSAHI